MKTVRTPKGTELPLLNLKGKDYLQVAHRIVWLNEAHPNFTLESQILTMTDNESVVRTVVTLKDENDKVIKIASATKRETTSGFADHLEKAETGSLGRALAMLGFGTAFAIADLDEGDRLADAPLPNTKKTVAPLAPVVVKPNVEAVQEAPQAEEVKKPVFIRNPNNKVWK